MGMRIHKNLVAAADYTAKQYFIMDHTTAGKATLANDADDPAAPLIGALQNKPNTGEPCVIPMDGEVDGLVICGGTVAVGDGLTTDGSGEAIKTTTAEDFVFGIALSAGVDGDIIRYRAVSYHATR